MTLRPQLEAEAKLYFAQQIFDHIVGQGLPPPDESWPEQAQRYEAASQDLTEARNHADNLTRAIERVNGRMKVTAGEVQYLPGMKDTFQVELTLKAAASSPGQQFSKHTRLCVGLEVTLKAWPLFDVMTNGPTGRWLVNFKRAQISLVGSLEAQIPFQVWNALAVLGLTEYERLALADTIQRKATARLKHAFDSEEL